MDKCDFCSDVKVVAELPAYDFSLPEFRYTSKGSWAACAICLELVRKQNLEYLLMRSVETFIKPDGWKTFPKVAALSIRKLHNGFFKNWTGKVIMLQDDSVNRKEEIHGADSGMV